MLAEEKTLCKKLVAVTYTEKAAKEIRDRVLANLLKKTERATPLRETCIGRVEFAFFGTIHAFASKFLKEHCALLGLGDDFEIATNEDSLWVEFLANFGDPLRVIPGDVRDAFLCAHDVEKLLTEAKNENWTEAYPWSKMGAAPPVAIGNILASTVHLNEFAEP